MKERFTDEKFRGASLKMIEQANEIIREYRAQGYTLTLRQLYYQLVSRDFIENTQKSYKRLGALISKARLAGYIDWSAIEDRGRFMRRTSMWDDPESILSAVANQYQENPWDTQAYAPEVWIEKDALVGVIAPICDELRISYFACRGYTSQSAQYEAGKRLAGLIADGKTPLVLHLGDHDPSGLDMTRDNRDRLDMFARQGVEVRRLALHMSQVEEYGPPPNPAKDTDSRFAAYRDEYGDESWELDALEPRVITGLIRENVEGLIDWSAWNEVIDREAANKKDLAAVVAQWPDVSAFVRENRA